MKVLGPVVVRLKHFQKAIENLRKLKDTEDTVQRGYRAEQSRAADTHNSVRLIMCVTVAESEN